MKELLGLPLDGSAHGPEIDALLVTIHWFIFAFFAGWLTFFVYSLIKFRKKNHPKADYRGAKSKISNYLEVAVALFEAVLLIGFSIPLWAKRVNQFPSEKDATVVHVIAEQFSWNIQYPGPDGVFGRRDIKLVSDSNPIGLDRTDPWAKDDITTINQLHVPVNKPVIIYLTTKDVIHSLSIPTMRVKQDALPGMSIPVWFIPVKTTKELIGSLAKPYSVVPGTISNDLFQMISADDYFSKNGTPIIKKGDFFSEDMIAQFESAGIKQVIAIPDITTEIACAQLCGLGHYRMRGYLTVETQAEFDAWMKDQEAALADTTGQFQ
jgi:cytochrome c oxidase subunit II